MVATRHSSPEHKNGDGSPQMNRLLLLMTTLGVCCLLDMHSLPDRASESNPGDHRLGAVGQEEGSRFGQPGHGGQERRQGSRTIAFEEREVLQVGVS